MHFRIDTDDLPDGKCVDKVHAVLREAILRGTFEPGRELSQVQIAKELGVSRTPLREALRLLQRERLIETRPNKRVRVAGFSVRDMEELYTLRITVEALAIRLTIPLATPEDIASLEGAMTQMAYFTQRHDPDRYQVPHRVFHAGLVAHAGDRVVDALRELSDHCERYRCRHTTRADRAWENAQEEHRAILDAFVAKDADVAASRLAEHLAHTVLGNLPLLDADYDPVSLKAALALVQRPKPERASQALNGRS